MTDRILVTGGTGFIGANLVKRLVKTGEEVHVLSRSKEVAWRLEGVEGEISLVAGDVTSRSHIEDVLRRVKPTGVMHLASIYSDRGPACDPTLVMMSNVLGTVNVIEAACRVSADWLVNAGSYFEYRSKSTCFRESDPLQSRTLYGFSKLCSSLYCQMVGESGRIGVANLRIATPYGPLDNPVKLIPTLFLASIRRDRVTLTNELSSRDYLFVEDLVGAILAVIKGCKEDKGYRDFNVGTGRSYSVMDVVSLVSELASSSIEIDWDSSHATAYDGTSMCSDISKISAELGWTPSTDIRTGLQLTHEWFKRNVNHYPGTSKAAN